MAEKQLISSAAVASRKRRSVGGSIRGRPSAVRANCELLLPTTSVDPTKLVKSSNRLGRRSLDSVTIASSAKGLSPSQSYHFAVPDQRQRSSSSISSDSSNQEVVSEQTASDEFHFSAPQALGVMQHREAMTSVQVPDPTSPSKYRKLESGPCSSLPRDPIGQPCPLKSTVSPNLLEQISIEIQERKRTEDTSTFDEDFLLKCTKEEMKKGSPLARKIHGSHSRRSSSYRLALKPAANCPEPSLQFDNVATSDKGLPVAMGDHPLVHPPEKCDDDRFPTIPKSVPLPRKQVSTVADEVIPQPKCSEMYSVPVTGGRRGLGKSTPKMTGSSSSPIGYVRSQVKKFSEQFFHSPVSDGGHLFDGDWLPIYK